MCRMCLYDLLCCSVSFGRAQAQLKCNNCQYTIWVFVWFYVWVISLLKICPLSNGAMRSVKQKTITKNKVINIGETRQVESKE